jgi:hypothetical protein
VSAAPDYSGANAPSTSPRLAAAAAASTGQRARGGRDLSGGKHRGRRARHPPRDRHRLALGSGHRVDARVASLPCLPEDDLGPCDARPLLAQGRAGRRDRVGFRNSVRARRAVAPAWAGDRAPTAAARTGATRRSGASCGARPDAAAERLVGLVGCVRRRCCAGTDSWSGGVGRTRTDRRGGRRSIVGSVTGCRPRRSEMSSHGALSSASTRRPPSRVISSRSRRPG